MASAGALKFLERATGLVRACGARMLRGPAAPSRARWGTLARSRSLATPSGSSPRDGPGNEKGTVAGALKFLERATGLEPASVSLGS